MFRIKRFNVLKTSTVVAVMYMVIVAIVVVPFALLVAIAGTGQMQGGLGPAVALGVVAILGYGLLGWLFTAVACLVYNLVAGWLGGIEVQVEVVAPAQPPPAWLNPGVTPPTAPTPPSPSV